MLAERSRRRARDGRSLAQCCATHAVGGLHCALAALHPQGCTLTPAPSAGDVTINVELENIKPGSSPIYIDDTNVTVTRLSYSDDGDTFLGYEVVPLADIPGVDEAEGVPFFTAEDTWLLETLAVRATMKCSCCHVCKQSALECAAAAAGWVRRTEV